MLEFIAQAVISPLAAARRPPGGSGGPGPARSAGPAGPSSGPLAAAPFLALAVGSAASSLAVWVSGAKPAGESRATLALLAGRLLFDAGAWLLVAALLSLFEPRREAGTAPWTVPVAVVAAQRVYLLPAAAIARLFGLAYVSNTARIAVWMWMGALLWLLAQQRGCSGQQATKLLFVALALPAALILVGAGLAGLGWIWSPLFPGGITPFPPL